MSLIRAGGLRFSVLYEIVGGTQKFSCGYLLYQAIYAA